jgi:transcription elongation factor Elf1
MGLERKIKQKESLIQKHQKELKKLFDFCTHETTAKKSYYFSGNYNDTAYTNYWDECIICGKQFNVKTVNHSWYG